ncbi:hypothetical protein FD755_003431 [Muntiacus reevesi]|uniref:Uncharacterized protein n=1 Tax=Muntiacus reevesi TaxID=9886 RepID=A0A5J5MMV1_MUNRE|nr:hypothetical protein FD755_003431 [Muntiacus reevesi]
MKSTWHRGKCSINAICGRSKGVTGDAVWPGRSLGLSQPLGWDAGSAWLFHTLRSVSPAPSLERAKASGQGAESPLFLDRPDFFDYPDSDQVKLLAVAQFIGEKPVIFANSGSDSRLFHHILVGALLIAFFFLLFQFCTHMSCEKGA